MVSLKWHHINKKNKKNVWVKILPTCQLHLREVEAAGERGKRRSASLPEGETGGQHTSRRGGRRS